MSRTKQLREAKGWSQGEMADYLGAHRTTVSRLESGQIPEDGPWERLLNELERDISAGAEAQAPESSGDEAAP